MSKIEQLYNLKKYNNDELSNIEETYDSMNGDFNQLYIGDDVDLLPEHIKVKYFHFLDDLKACQIDVSLLDKPLIIRTVYALHIVQELEKELQNSDLIQYTNSKYSKGEAKPSAILKTYFEACSHLQKCFDSLNIDSKSRLKLARTKIESQRKNNTSWENDDLW